ncbi:MAG TPA: HIT domain-containing protein [Thermomicrobiales bacterium]|nr:HIT domain-containing protein [Thermomicrobiales bacterium]
MERLWTPWRMSYVSERGTSGCVLCVPDSPAHDIERLIVQRGENAYSMLNLYPYNTGHVLIVPYQHVASFDQVDRETRHEMFDLAALFMEIARRVLRCDGFNMGMNVGETAGAGVAEHIHLHVVPRWTGDANFMPILAGTIVLPELLPVTYARLRAELELTLATRDRGAVPEAGAVVLVRGRGAVVLRRSPTGEIVLPKGRVEPGETTVAAALREVREQTGIQAEPAGWAGSSTFDWTTDGGRTETRHVAYVVGVGTLTCDAQRHLGDDTLLVPIDDAAGMLGVQALSSMLESLVPTLHRLSGSEQ